MYKYILLTRNSQSGCISVTSSIRSLLYSKRVSGIMVDESSSSVADNNRACCTPDFDINILIRAENCEVCVEEW